MKICPTCNKRIVGNKRYADHIATHNTEIPEPVAEVKEVIETVEEVKPVGEPVPEPVSEKVTLKFSKPVEVTINGIPYRGITVVAPDIEVATEIVRIAREAYGVAILAGI